MSALPGAFRTLGTPSPPIGHACALELIPIGKFFLETAPALT